MSRSQRGGYPTDLTDEQWTQLVPLLRPPVERRGRGRPPTVDLRRVVDALFLYQPDGMPMALSAAGVPGLGRRPVLLRYSINGSRTAPGNG